MPTKVKKKEPWMKFRHRVIRNLASCLIGPYVRLKTGIRIKPFREKEQRQYLIVSNHQTGFDQFFVGMAFRGPVYYIASEDLFSNGFVSKLLRWAVNPIPIKKQTTDVKAVMNCMRVAREGGTIALFPEGNRTYDGKPVYIKPGIVGLMRKLGLPLAIFRIEGGYGVQPRWADDCRKGKMRAYVSEVIEPEEYNRLNNDELYERVCKALYVNEACVNGEFPGKHRAEYLERAMYVCPKCGLSTFESHGNTVACKQCGLSAEYLSTKELKGFPFRFVSDWYDYQKEFVSSLDVMQYLEEPLYRDVAELSEVIVYKKKIALRKNAEVSLYGDRIVLDEGKENTLVFPFADVLSVTVLGRNKLNIYCGDHLYQLKSGKRFNALKYVNIYFRHKNITKGDGNETFLGL